MTLTQILQKIKSAFYTKTETESKLNAKANASDLNNYFPKLGGTLTGGVVQRDVNNDTLDIQGAYGGENGARVLLVGKDYPDADLSGNFFIDAQNGANMARLRGTPNGSLIWNGKQVAVSGDYLPLSGGQLTGSMITRNVDNDTIQIHAGVAWKHGAYIHLAGKDYQNVYGDGYGAFAIAAHNGTNEFKLSGKADGSLTWNNKAIDVIEEQGDGYIRYSNGLQICWGVIVGLDSNDKPINFPKVFKDNPQCFCSGQRSDVLLAGWSQAQVILKLDTNFNSGGSYNYLAIGRWK